MTRHVLRPSMAHVGPTASPQQSNCEKGIFTKKEMHLHGRRGTITVGVNRCTRPHKALKATLWVGAHLPTQRQRTDDSTDCDEQD